MMASQHRYVPNPMKHLTLNRPVQHPKTYPSKLARGVNIKNNDSSRVRCFIRVWHIPKPAVADTPFVGSISPASFYG